MTTDLAKELPLEEALLPYKNKVYMLFEGQWWRSGLTNWQHVEGDMLGHKALAKMRAKRCEEVPDCIHRAVALTQMFPYGDGRRNNRYLQHVGFINGHSHGFVSFLPGWNEG